MKKRKVLIGALSAGVVLSPIASQYTPIVDSASAATQVQVTPKQFFPSYVISELRYSLTRVQVDVCNFVVGSPIGLMPPFGRGQSHNIWTNAQGKVSFDYPLDVATANDSKLWTEEGLEITIGKKLYAPIMNQLVTTDSTVVTGYGIPDAKITLKKGTQTLGEVLVNQWGQYALTIPKQTSGTILSIVQSKNNETSIETKTTVLAPATWTTPIVYKTDTHAVVFGNGSPGEKIELGDYTTYAREEAIVNANGNYEIRMDVAQTSNAMGLMHARTEHHYFGEHLETPRVTGSVTPSAIKVGSSYVRGTFTGAVTKGLLVINGNPETLRGEFTGTEFRYYVDPSKFKAGDRLEFIGFNSANKVITQGETVRVTP
ncbi:Ig-like domain-containing protein [Listeria booriae]|uniref:Uncharacterized protein n=1 Tax=Listeria booriae TaxID=1552123 RepID=A0A099W2W9_9LIST|nr:Ig-like domain-containing protein [Listeria booriae]KGL38415.1 hypothetical protein EP57_14690 [Listeria booriae]STY46153.1 Uncharacterised protein [Listeria booriae]